MNVLTLKKGHPGFSLVEVLIALLLMGIVGLGIFTGMAFSSKHSINANVRSTAESIARSEIEYIKTLDYDAINNPPQYTPASMPSLGMDASWTITTSFARLDPKGDGTANDDGIQKILVNVLHSGINILTVEGYKLH